MNEALLLHFASLVQTWPAERFWFFSFCGGSLDCQDPLEPTQKPSIPLFGRFSFFDKTYFKGFFFSSLSFYFVFIARVVLFELVSSGGRSLH